MSLRWVLTGVLVAGLALAGIASEMSGSSPATETVTVPAGAELAVTLESRLASDVNQAGDTVRAALARPLAVDGRTIVPAGAAVEGVVTSARPSGKVKGRAHLGLRFTAIEVDGDTREIATSEVSRTAPATKKADAEKIGIGAGAGAIVGAIAGGKKGAAIGSAVGGGAGTGVVLATAGKEVEFAPGRTFTVRLTGPLAVDVPRS
ncbi:MAG: hypothetical protein AB7H88_19690 [Vicinamibacterales bacterium]